MRLHRLIPCVLLAAAGALHAQAADPLKSPECTQALSQLQAARAGERPQAAAVERLRHAAAKACLGSGDAPARPGRVAQAPIAVPPPRMDAPSRLPVPVPTPAPAQVPRAPVITSCDAAGCWADTGGSHLQRVPPILMAPGGLCAQAPGAAGCP